MARKVASSKALQEKDPNANTAPTTSPPEDKSSPKQQKNQKKDATQPTTAASLSTIHLEGEETEDVPIYATCDDIRKQVNAHLPITTKAAFARELTELLPNSKVTPRNLDALLKMRGPLAGSHNIAFYASYVFFEKIRVRDGKKKSAKREKMETIHTGGDRILGTNEIRKPGVSREGSHTMGMICAVGEKPKLDQYGKMHLQGHPSGKGGYTLNDNDVSMELDELSLPKSPEDCPHVVDAATSQEEVASSESRPQAAESGTVSHKPSPLAEGPSSLGSNSLPGEESEATPIYATCADMRRAITTHLKTSKTNKAAFSRELSDLLPTSKVPTRALYRFMEASGPQAAGHNITFYAAWVYFEKLRIKEGKEKTEKRQKMEKIWGKKGFRRMNGNNMALTLQQGKNWTMNDYGQVEILSENGRVERVETPSLRP